MKRILFLFCSTLLLSACAPSLYTTPDTTVLLQNCSSAAVDWADATHTKLIIACGGSGAPPITPPVQPPGSLTCVGFTATRVIDLPFVPSVRVFTKDFGGFGPNDAIVARFTTTGGPSITNNMPRVIGAEWIDPLYVRAATLSEKPCDFGPQPAAGATNLGTSLSIPFAVNNAASGGGYYPNLKPNTTYYFNIKNNVGGGCTTSCNMFIDLYNANTP